MLYLSLINSFYFLRPCPLPLFLSLSHSFADVFLTVCVTLSGRWLHCPRTSSHLGRRHVSGPDGLDPRCVYPRRLAGRTTCFPLLPACAWSFSGPRAFFRRSLPYRSEVCTDARCLAATICTALTCRDSSPSLLLSAASEYRLALLCF